MAKKWSKASYGKTALSARFSVTGVEEFFKAIQDAGKNCDEACKKAIDSALPVVTESMKAGAERHRRTGEVVDALEVQEACYQGNYIYGQVGIDLDKHPEAFEAVFQEYGDGHSPEFPDPFVRPAVDDNRSKINGIIKQVLKKEGIPVE